MKWLWWSLAAVALVLSVLFVVPFPVHAQVPSFTLTWTAPGDDGNVGTATSYDLRWDTTRPDTTSTTAFNAWWAAANVVSGMPAPLVAGTTQSKVVSATFVTGTHYYFVIRSTDDAGNVSGYSNVADKFVPDATPPAPILDLR